MVLGKESPLSAQPSVAERIQGVRKMFVLYRETEEHMFFPRLHDSLVPSVTKLQIQAVRDWERSLLDS